jgi:predicted N-acetyltransferase YhbS
MTAEFTVRPARPSDAPALAALRLRFRQEEHGGSPPPPDPARPPAGAEEWFRDRLREGRWLAWVAETGDGIIGHVFLNTVERIPDPHGDSSPIGYVTNFHVIPAHRNRGAGTALLAALERHARAAPYDTLIVWPSERSAPLYGRSGFRHPEELRELPLEG